MGSSCCGQMSLQKEIKQSDITLDFPNQTTDQINLTLNDSLIPNNQLVKMSPVMYKMYKYGPIYRKIAMNKKN